MFAFEGLFFRAFLKVDELSSDSYIGRDDFLFTKSLDICSRSNLIFRALIFLNSIHFLCLKDLNSTIEQ